MNKKKSTVTKCLMCFLVISFFYNCEKDSVVENQEESSIEKKEPLFSSRLMYSNEIKSNSILNKKLGSFNQANNGVISKNSQDDFIIDTQVAKYIEKADGSSYSYTFRVFRENFQNTELENLVVSVNSDTQELNTAIIKYDFSEAQTSEFLNTGHVSTNYETTVIPIDGDFSNLLPKNNLIPCTHVVETYHTVPDTGETFNGSSGTCQHINDETGESDCEVYTVIVIDCPTGGSGGPGSASGTTEPSSSDSSSSTSGGGIVNNGNDNSGNDNDIVTSPILMPHQVISDCMNSNSFNPRLSEEMLNWLQNNRFDSSAISNYLKNVGCDDSAKDFIEDAIEAMMGNPDLTFEDYIRERVEELLEDRPFALIDVPCSELEKWQALALHTPPASVINRVHAIDNQHTTYFTDYSIQTLENAQGHLVNMDHFQVEIEQFPTNPSTNLPYTPEEFLTYIRLNINTLVDNDWAFFEPVVYQDGSFSIDDTELWNSNNPLTALLTIDIPIDQGTVIVSDYSASNFTFITLETPWDSEHPVSGVRDFGFVQNPDGTYSFYTRAVDRMADGLDYAVANSSIPNDAAFFGSDALWTSFQDKLEAFVNFNGGQAVAYDRDTFRPKWEKIRKVLRGEVSIDELDCWEWE